MQWIIADDLAFWLELNCLTVKKSKLLFDEVICSFIIIISDSHQLLLELFPLHLIWLFLNFDHQVNKVLLPC
jgi:hypothetical protein